MGTGRLTVQGPKGRLFSIDRASVSPRCGVRQSSPTQERSTTATMATDRDGTRPPEGASGGGRTTRRQLPATRPQDPAPPQQSSTQPATSASDLARLAGVEVDVTLLLGRTEITLEEAAQLDEKSLLAVDKRADEPVRGVGERRALRARQARYGGQSLRGSTVGDGRPVI